MKFFKDKTHIDFMGKRRIALGGSSLAVLTSIVFLVIFGLNFGLDFTGGTEVEARFEKAPEISAVRESLTKAGMPDAVVQTFGTPDEILVRIPLSAKNEKPADQATVVITALDKDFDGKVEMRSSGYVGPQVGEELTEQGILAVLYALIGIFIYVMFRFQWRFSAGAVIAVIHDVLITLGVLSILKVSFDLTVVAAVLAVVGYSLNDTIVVYDRIRENFPRLGKHTPAGVINVSVNETLSRTIMTSGTTLLVLFALFFLGGEAIHAFALTLIVGIAVGTYSSIYVASAATLLLGVSKYDLLSVEKEGADVRTRP